MRVLNEISILQTKRAHAFGKLLIGNLKRFSMRQICQPTGCSTGLRHLRNAFRFLIDPSILSDKMRDRTQPGDI